MSESQLIFKREDMRSRLVRTDTNWFAVEYKTPDMEQWFPWIWGTRDFLNLTEQEFSWAVDKRRTKCQSQSIP